MIAFSHFASVRPLIATAVALAVAACASTGPAQSQDLQVPEPVMQDAPTYADLVDMAMAADTAVVVEVEEQIPFPPERVPDLPPEIVRLYVEANVQSLLVAPQPVGEQLVFVVDRRRDSRGDAPDLEERAFILLGDLSRSQPGAIQLLSSDSMLPASPQVEARVRRVLTQLAQGDVPPAITGLRDVISVPGNLAGESETQMFVETETGAPVSLSVIRRPGMAPQWGVSLGELVDASARPPEPETIAWYRFACFLPRELPADSFLQTDRASQAQAREDYAYVLARLGPCERRLG